MEDTCKRGAVGLALMLAATGSAEARHHARPTHCATPIEVTAVAATSIQQELMVAALTCNQIANFNAFQTNYSLELRASDKALMRMFMRLYGGAKGPAEYHGFKTRLANNSEMRSIHGNTEFCTTTSQVFAAALAVNKPTLHDFVSGVEVSDPAPVESCEMQVALGLQGVMASLNIIPRQKPVQFQDVSLPGATAPLTAQPAILQTQAQPAATTAQATPAPASTTGPAPAAPAAPAATSVASATPAAASTAASPAATDAANPEAKKKGWLSGLWHWH